MSNVTNVTDTYTPLPPAPKTIEKYHEIAVSPTVSLPDIYNSLQPAERVFLYLLFRAGLPGNRMLAEQLHRDANKLKELFEKIVRGKQLLLDAQTQLSFDASLFVEQATTFCVYLWTNHCNYFTRENADHKRTPEMLGLNLITQENLVQALECVEVSNAAAHVNRLATTIFNKKSEPTLVVPGSIEQSAGNMYSVDFTQDDYDQLPAAERKAINAYFYVAEHDEQRIPRSLRYKIDGKYNRELRVAHYWLQEAMVYAQMHPECFDKHIVKSLEYLLLFLENGDESIFKKHSVEWLKTKSRVDYTYGFIETYMDPKSYRGTFTAEGTVKSLDIAKLSAMLPSIEAQLPLPPEFKRDNLASGTASIPNASINKQVWGTGEYGPLQCVAAYCLPNYAEIRSDHGSKQIIYETEKGLGQTINPDVSKKLNHLRAEREWSEKHDPDFQLGRDLWTVQVILHETLGHGSGKLAMHTFRDGEELTVGGVTYNVGDQLPVTSGNIQQFLVGYDQTLEELRAEIIALYTSIAHYDELAKEGLYKEWPEKVEKSKMIDELIINMAGTGLNRLLVQQLDAEEISGDHARANYTIMNYLIDHGGLEIVEEKVMHEGTEFTVLGLCVTDQTKTIENITKLMQEVQRIKSTADTLALRILIETYGKKVRNKKHIAYKQEVRKAVVGNLKARATLYPEFTPVINELGQIVDITATWPSSIVEQQLRWSDLMMSIE